MHPRDRSPRSGAAALLAAGAAAIAIAATVGVAGSAAAGTRGCIAAASEFAAGTTQVARATALHSYDDYIEDVVSAPDICAANVVTNDNVGKITIGLHIHDRDGFAAGDGYLLMLDTDKNAATGSIAAPSSPAGAEYAIDILGGASTLQRWNGTAFEPVATQSPIATEWLEDYGPVLEVNAADLGSATGFDLVYVTTNATDFDLAPDSGTWSYTMSQLELTAGRLLIGPARVGKPLVAAMEVTRSDFDIPLDEGKIACAGKLAGKPLAGRAAFGADLVGCMWRVPKAAKGKRIVASVAVTFQGVTAKRAFTVRVK